MLKFRFWFDPLDRGFINEAIINLFARHYDKTPRKLERANYKLEQVYFITEGGFGLYNPKLHYSSPRTEKTPFVIIKPFSVFGDFQLIQDTEPGWDFSPYVPNNKTPLSVLNELGPDAEVDVFNIMALDGDKFEELCDLYPDSRQTILKNALGRRKLFMR